MFNQILFEDNHIIIINKIAGDIIQTDDSGDKTLRDDVKDYIKKKYSKPGNAFIGIVHRLDRPVSGAVMFARTSKALSRLNKMFREREVKKTYWAVVNNLPPNSEGHLIDYLIKNKLKNKSYIVNKEQTNALKAELKYRLLGKGDNYYLLEVTLLTGRHHQIRAQLANTGCYIKGDLKYGFPRSNPDASIHLHARKIEFIHPVKREPVSIIAPTPDDPLWNYFAEQQEIGKTK